jgi:hypothetical protein
MLATATPTIVTNEDRLARRVAAFNARPGPRVGDYLQIPPADPRAPEYTRFTHDWGDTIQTGGTSTGSYYFTSTGYLSYSGSLDPGIATADLVATTATKPGRIWFFDDDISGPGRGVDFDIECRVFHARPGADLSQLYDLLCPYWLQVCDQEMEQRHGYKFTITKHGYSARAFKLPAELDAWLAEERLSLTKPIEAGGHQRLNWGNPS